jgi:WD40 repeat protein
LYFIKQTIFYITYTIKIKIINLIKKMRLNINIIQVILHNYQNTKLLSLAFNKIQSKIIIEKVTRIKQSHYKQFTSKPEIFEMRCFEISKILQINENLLAVVYDNFMNHIIEIWDIKTHTCINTINDHSNLICFTTVLKNSMLVSSSIDGVLKITQFNSEGKTIHTYQYIGTYTTYIAVLQQLSNERLAAGSANGFMEILSLDLNTVYNHLDNLHSRKVSIIKELINGDILTAGMDGVMNILDTSFHILYKLDDHTDSIGYVEECGGVIYSCSRDRTIRLWKDYKCCATLEGHQCGVKRIFVLSADVFLSCSTRGEFKLWKDNVCVKTRCEEYGDKSLVKCGFIRLQDRRILFANDIELLFLNISDLSVTRLMGDYGDFECICELSDGRLATGNVGMFKVWNTINNN